MTDDRRNDLGNKIRDGLVTAGITTVLGLFIHTTWLTANEGKNKSTENEVKIVEEAGKTAALKEMVVMILNDVKDIKANQQKGGR